MPVSWYFGTLRLQLRLPVDLGHAELHGYEVFGRKEGLWPSASVKLYVIIEVKQC